jgi:hypothetical protein
VRAVVPLRIDDLRIDDLRADAEEKAFGLLLLQAPVATR